MLPGVDAQQGLEVARDGVLVRAGDEAERARGLVLDEPGPAGALDAGEGRVGLLLEGVERAEVFVDGGLQTRYVVSIKHMMGKEGSLVDWLLTRSLPSGSPPPPLPWGARFSQKRLWFRWPPPWKLSRGAWAAAATLSPLAVASPMASTAALRPLTYVWWCLEWWSSMICPEM